MPPKSEAAAVKEDVIASGNPSGRLSRKLSTISFKGATVGLKRDTEQTYVMEDATNNAALRQHEQGHEEINRQVTAQQTDILQSTKIEIYTTSEGADSRSFAKPAAQVIVNMNLMDAGATKNALNKQYDDATDHGLNEEAQAEWTKKLSGTP
jgi:hypothetical protein